MRGLDALVNIKDILRRRPDRHDAALAADGLPLPSEELRALVALNVDVHSFLSSGRREARMIEETLARHGLRMSDFGSVLDFGCGCGRIIRHWHDLDNVQLHGSDYNPELVAWCAKNLQFARFSRNRDRPPLVYHAGKFDFISAFSVFTHLTQDLQQLWITELRRVLKPRGHLLLTTHGDSYIDHLDAREREQLRAGELVVQVPDAVGTNVCNAFHPPSYVRERLAVAFEVVEHKPGLGWYHDVWLLRKRDGEGIVR